MKSEKSKLASPRPSPVGEGVIPLRGGRGSFPLKGETSPSPAGEGWGEAVGDGEGPEGWSGYIAIKLSKIVFADETFGAFLLCSDEKMCSFFVYLSFFRTFAATNGTEHGPC